MSSADSIPVGSLALRALLPLAVFCLTPRPAPAQDWFVDADRPAGGDGLSWQTAFDDLQDALELVQPGQQVWVAEGVYRPSVPGDLTAPRSASFLLPFEVRIYGGFDGSEASLDQRAGLFDRTILSGDLGVRGDASDNAFHVVSMVGPKQGPQAAPTVLDGFTIRDGNGLIAGSAPRRGGGVHITANGQHGPWLELGHCILSHNVSGDGGAITVLNLAALQMRDCLVRDNVAVGFGGGIHCVTASNVRSFNCSWLDNHADEGGAVFLNSSFPDSIWFVNSVFRGNVARRGGAAMIRDAQFTAGHGDWILCTIALNRASEAGGAFHAGQDGSVKAELELYNSIVWGNTTTSGVDEAIYGGAQVRWCDVQGGWAGTGNLALDPLFVDLAAGDLHTRAGSPAHDAGNNSLIPPDLTDLDGDGQLYEPVPFDLDGRPRLADDPAAPDTGAGWPGSQRPIVDMGAYEHAP